MHGESTWYAWCIECPALCSFHHWGSRALAFNFLEDIVTKGSCAIIESSNHEKRQKSCQCQFLLKLQGKILSIILWFLQHYCFPRRGFQNCQSFSKKTTENCEGLLVKNLRTCGSPRRYEEKSKWRFWRRRSKIEKKAEGEKRRFWSEINFGRKVGIMGKNNESSPQIYSSGSDNRSDHHT